MRKLNFELLLVFLLTILINPSSFAALTVVQLGSNQTVAASITANSATLTGATNVLFVVPDSYTGQAGANTDLTGLPSTVKAVTFRGATASSTMKTNQINVSATNALDSLNLRRLTLYGVDDGAAVGQYLFYPGSGMSVGFFTVDSCTIKNYNGAIRTGGGTVKNIKVNHSIIRNLGGYGFLTYSLANTVGSPATATITNSTFYDIQASMFYMNNSSYANVNISNCTFDNILTGTNVFYRPGSNGDLTIANSIFGKTLSSTSVGLYAAPATKSISGCYYTTDWVNSNTTLTTSLTSYSSASTALFTTPTTYNSTTLTSSTVGDYAIKDANFSGKTSSGDPRWYMQITTVYSVSSSVFPINTGSCSPTSASYNDGTSVTVTATKNVFGYGFKEWQDGSGNFVSTNNPYNFTIHENTTLVAVFESITTYDFAVTKTGTGANWGVVSLSPAPTNGKYEAGTVVTATIGNSNIAIFNQWEDASTATSRNYTINSNTIVNPDFTVIPFITGWDFVSADPRQRRGGDYYYSSSNKGMFTMYENAGTDASWLASTVGGVSCARMWNPPANFATPRYYQASFSTLGYKDIQVKSKVTSTYHCYPVMKLLYSTDSINYTQLNTVNITSVYGSSWVDLNATLPIGANNQNRVYIRWIEDTSSSPILGNAADVDGSAIANVYVTATTLVTATAGDYIATKSGDIGDLNNLSVTDGICITGKPGSAPTTSTNLVIPAGITMTNSASASCNSLQIRGNYTASAGLTVAGNMIVKSDAEGTGTIISNGNIAVTGTTTVQQYLKDARNWYVSTPVGNATAPSGFTYYQYDETGNHPSAVGPYWFSVAQGAALTPGTGYIVLPNTAGDTFNFTTPAGGSLNTGNVDVTLTKSGALKTGFNLIGNPYPAHLTWTQTFVDNNVAKIEPTVWYRTNAGSTNNSNQWSFLTYNAHTGEGTPLGTTGIIPPMQAFWVRAVSAGTLTLNSDLVLSHQASNPLKAPHKNNSDRERLRLQLTNKTSADETLLYFDELALNGFDAFDSPKMSNNSASIPEIYSTSGNEKVALNGLSKTNRISEIALGYAIGKVDTLTLKVIQEENFDADMQIILKDNELNTETDLTVQPEYTFISNAANTSARFTLLFKSAGVTTGLSKNQAETMHVFAENQDLIINCQNASDRHSVIKVYTMLGQLKFTGKLQGTTTRIPNILSQGIYLIEVNTESGKFVKKLVNQY